MSDREESEYIHLCARELSGNLTDHEKVRLDQLDRIASGVPRDTDCESDRFGAGA